MLYYLKQSNRTKVLITYGSLIFKEVKECIQKAIIAARHSLCLIVIVLGNNVRFLENEVMIIDD